MIRAKLARARLPLAFEALPMAESAFRFEARSHAKARGLWQFMPNSAKHYGLKISRNVDQRSDPARATDAAIKYLKYLKRKFEKTSILLAVAAYNAGQGRIAKVVRKSGVKNRRRGYSHVLRYLPKETRGYVPEFLAAALIMKDPGYFGFPVTKKRSYHYVQVRHPITIKKLAVLAKLSVKHLKLLNPDLKKYRRIPTSNFFVRLPIKAAWRVRKKLSSSRLWKPVTTQIAFNQSGRKVAPFYVAKSKKDRERSKYVKSSNQVVYKVEKGNYLGGIAKIFGASIQKLRKVNRIQGNRIRQGQFLIIPVKKTLTRRFYRIRTGDNLGMISKRLGVPVQHLKFVNGVTNPKRLRPGQQLYYYES